MGQWPHSASRRRDRGVVEGGRSVVFRFDAGLEPATIALTNLVLKFVLGIWCHTTTLSSSDACRRKRVAGSVLKLVLAIGMWGHTITLSPRDACRSTLLAGAVLKLVFVIDFRRTSDASVCRLSVFLEHWRI